MEDNCAAAWKSGSILASIVCPFGVKGSIVDVGHDDDDEVGEGTGEPF
jgi:hypothetical protein